MKHNELYTFIRRLLVLAIPVDVIFVVYLLLDPFKVIWSYDRFFDDNVAHVGLNMDHVSTENFLSRNPSMHYNAFIFGNSRSQYWQTEYWQRYIGRQVRCYHYFGNGESLYNMSKNVQFVANSGSNIDYALLIVDASLLSQTEARTGHLSCTPPKTVGYRNVVQFHATNFVAFLHPVFVYTYIDYQVSKTLKPYMLERFYFEQPVVYDANSNEIVDQMFDQAIDNGTYYTDQRRQRFQGKQFPDSISLSVLGEENIRMLRDIADILHRHHTQYKVVINPLYDQIRFNPADLRVLRDIFGASSVYDFSGKNSITSDYRNYYEDSHYRPFIARQLMDSLYLQRAVSQ